VWEAREVHGSALTLLLRGSVRRLVLFREAGTFRSYILRRNRVGLRLFGFRRRRTVSYVGVGGYVHTYGDRKTCST
jgi:hypothetical protein